MTTNPYAFPTGPGELLAQAPPDTCLFRLSATTCEADTFNIAQSARAELIQTALLRLIGFGIIGSYFAFLFVVTGYSDSSVSNFILTMGLLILQCSAVVQILGLWQQYRQNLKIPCTLSRYPIELNGFTKGLHWNAADFEQISLWPIVKRLTITPGLAILFAPSFIHRYATVLEPIAFDGGISFDKLPKTVAKHVFMQSRRIISSKLMEPHQFDSIHFDSPNAVYLGTVGTSYLANDDRVEWLTNGFMLFWFWLTPVLVFVISVVGLMQSFSNSSFLLNMTRITVIIVVLWIFYRIRHNLIRFVALYCFRNTLVSEYELLVSEQGFETRTHCSHARVRWSFFRNPQLETERLTAESLATGPRVRVFSRELMANDQDWKQVTSLAMKAISVAIGRATIAL